MTVNDVNTRGQGVHGLKQQKQVLSRCILSSRALLRGMRDTVWRLMWVHMALEAHLLDWNIKKWCVEIQ